MTVCIQGACEVTDMQILSSIWNETDYLFDVCRINTQRGSHSYPVSDNENVETYTLCLQV